MSVFDIPRFLYMMTDSVLTATYGSPSATYRVGIHAIGEIFLVFMV